MKLFFLALASLIVSATTHAEMTPKQAVEAYYAKQLQLTYVETLLKQSSKGEFQATHNGRHCDDGEGGEKRKSCVDTVCDHLGAYGCDHYSEIERVTRMCRGLRHGGCIEKSCELLGTYGCDHHSEVERVAQMCKTQHNGRCLKTACTFLGDYECDHISELERVANACQGWVDISCVKSSCERLGPYGCDHTSEVSRVIELCKGED